HHLYLALILIRHFNRSTRGQMMSFLRRKKVLMINSSTLKSLDPNKKAVTNIDHVSCLNSLSVMLQSFLAPSGV
ncbi:MAG TPA: hypothetical protein H9869_02895, partial [Candidatus Ligilactobacillus excrementipullorum]|nr:hypothetical protein [Candidatus Ligilactobacillus excrementipullorum]